MRYLKYNEEFKEMTDPDLLKLVDDIRKLANECLAYLIDDGFSVSVGKKPFKVNNELGWCYLPEFFFCKKVGEVDEYNTMTVEKFNWEEIKDDFIPFLEICNERFLLYRVLITTSNFHKVDVSDLINEVDIPLLKNRISNISFFIENK